MRSSTKYVGLDVHQATTIAAVCESSGKVIARSILPTEEGALLRARVKDDWPAPGSPVAPPIP